MSVKRILLRQKVGGRGFRRRGLKLIGTLSNYDDDDNDNDNAKKKKNNWFYEQNNSSAGPLTSTARLRCETSQCDVLWRTWTYDNKFFFLYLNMDKVLKNSPPKQVAYIARIERFQIDMLMFEKTQIYFF